MHSYFHAPVISQAVKWMLKLKKKNCTPYKNYVRIFIGSYFGSILEKRIIDWYNWSVLKKLDSKKNLIEVVPNFSTCNNAPSEM